MGSCMDFSVFRRYGIIILEREMVRFVMSKERMKGLAFTERERAELKRARALPIVFDGDCPETTPEQALKFKRVNPVTPDGTAKQLCKMDA